MTQLPTTWYCELAKNPRVTGGQASRGVAAASGLGIMPLLEKYSSSISSLNTNQDASVTGGEYVY